MRAETIWTGQVIVWALVAGLLGTAGWCVVQGIREGFAWRRTEQRIAAIGREQIEGRR